jgi:hypothetical protein
MQKLIVNADGEVEYVELTEEEMAALVAEQEAEQARQLESTERRNRANDILTTLEQADDNWGTLTNAQKDAVLRLTVRAVAKMGRRMMHILGE